MTLNLGSKKDILYPPKMELCGIEEDWVCTFTSFTSSQTSQTGKKGFILHRLSSTSIVKGGFHLADLVIFDLRGPFLASADLNLRPPYDLSVSYFSLKHSNYL